MESPSSEAPRKSRQTAPLHNLERYTFTDYTPPTRDATSRPLTAGDIQILLKHSNHFKVEINGTKTKALKTRTDKGYIPEGNFMHFGVNPSNTLFLDSCPDDTPLCLLKLSKTVGNKGQLGYLFVPYLLDEKRQLYIPAGAFLSENVNGMWPAGTTLAVKDILFLTTKSLLVKTLLEAVDQIKANGPNLPTTQEILAGLPHAMKIELFYSFIFVFKQKTQTRGKPEGYWIIRTNMTKSIHEEDEDGNQINNTIYARFFVHSDGANRFLELFTGVYSRNDAKCMEAYTAEQHLMKVFLGFDEPINTVAEGKPCKRARQIQMIPCESLAGLDAYKRHLTIAKTEAGEPDPDYRPPGYVLPEVHPAEELMKANQETCMDLIINIIATERTYFIAPPPSNRIKETSIRKFLGCPDLAPGTKDEIEALFRDVMANTQEALTTAGRALAVTFSYYEFNNEVIKKLFLNREFRTKMETLFGRSDRGPHLNAKLYSCILFDLTYTVASEAFNICGGRNYFKVDGRLEKTLVPPDISYEAYMSLMTPVDDIRYNPSYDTITKCDWLKCLAPDRAHKIDCITKPDAEGKTQKFTLLVMVTYRRNRNKVKAVLQFRELVHQGWDYSLIIENTIVPFEYEPDDKSIQLWIFERLVRQLLAEFIKGPRDTPETKVLYITHKEIPDEFVADIRESSSWTIAAQLEAVFFGYAFEPPIQNIVDTIVLPTEDELDAIMSTELRDQVEGQLKMLTTPTRLFLSGLSRMIKKFDGSDMDNFEHGCTVADSDLCALVHMACQPIVSYVNAPGTTFLAREYEEEFTLREDLKNPFDYFPKKYICPDRQWAEIDVLVKPSDSEVIAHAEEMEEEEGEEDVVMGGRPRHA